MSYQTYSAFGLTLASDLPLPELAREEGTTDADVRIRTGAVMAPESLGPGLHRADEGLVMLVPGVARFAIAGGNEIIIESEPGVPDRNVRLYLLGSAIGALLHQRGLLPLHASAVEFDGTAVAFMGESGAGKSTLATWFYDRNCRVLADDVCAVHIAGGRVHVAPGPRRVRLWRDALERTGRESSNYHRSYIASIPEDKYDVPIRADGTVKSALSLAAIYLLERGEEFSVTELSRLAATQAAFAHTYRGSFVAQTQTVGHYFRSCVSLVESTPIYLVARKWDLNSVDEQHQLILDHVEQVAGSKLRV